MKETKWKQADMTYRGRRHAMMNVPCQDKTSYAGKDNIRVIALADGAGSMADAELGALVTAKAITEHIMNRFFGYIEQMREKEDAKVRDAIITYLHERLHQAADEHHARFREMGATLLFAAVHEDTLFYGHIGDGIIGAYTNDGRVEVLSEPENGFLPNITVFVTEPEPRKHLRMNVTEMKDIKGIVLMSDGPGEYFYDRRQGFIKETKQLFDAFENKTKAEYQRTLHDYMKDDLSHRSGDDLSVNILYQE